MNVGNVSGFNPVTTLKVWVSHVLPLVYDDTLSYMELLGKVTYKLNELIENNNKLPEYIAELMSDDKLKEILSTLLNQLEEQIASANEGTSKTATKPRSIGDLVWLDGYLYKITHNMIAGDQYVVGSNCVKITIEEQIKNVYTELQNNINSEASYRESADTELQNNINSEASSRESADAELQNNINSEASSRESADAELQNNINSEASSRKSADAELQNNINSEASSRESADAELQNNINSEASSRESADAELQNNINSEASYRESADTELQNNINSEASYRESADTELQNNINAIETKINNLKVYNVLDYGAKGDGVTDDYNSIQTLINNTSLGGIIYFPSGVYLVGDTLSITRDNVYLIGEGFHSIIYANHAGDIIKYNVTLGGGVKSLHIATKVVRSGDNYAIKISKGERLYINDLTTFRYGNTESTGSGIYLSASMTFLHQINIEISTTSGQGIAIVGGNDRYISQAWIRNASIGNATGIIINESGGDWLSDIDIVQFNEGLIEAGSRWTSLNNVLCDTNAQNGFRFDANSQGIRMTNCWGSTNGITNLGVGLYVGSCSGLVCTSSSFLNNGGYGVHLSSGASNISLCGCFIEHNSITQTGSHCGIQLENPNGVIINGCFSGKTTTQTSTQSYGIEIQGNSTNLIITNNKFSDNVVGSINSAVTPSNTIIIDNNIV